jgi:succinylglutamic semialdehyde dehydrogenase
MCPPEQLVSTDPCTGESLWEGLVAGAGEVAAAVDAARAAYPEWAMAAGQHRHAVARRFAEGVKAQAEPFARLIAQETGKPLWEARTEVASTAAKVEISIAAQSARAATVEGEVAGTRSVTRHKPHGVLAVLGPYNFPAHLPNGHIVPALIAGNACVFKPSEHTPAVGAFMAGLWAEAGLPAGVLGVVHGAAATGKALAAADIDGLLFTGSAGAGAALARQFAETPGRILALEMGGNNPLIVWDLASDSIEAAAALVVQSAYLSAGQRCTNARRLIVEERAAGPLIEALTALIDRLIVDHPFADPQPFLGPVINNVAAEQLITAAAALAGEGARPLRPLVRLNPARPFLTPALFDVTGLRPRPDDELFGPLLQLVRVNSFEAAMQQANATRFGLAAGLIGGDAALYQRFWSASRAGVVNWNRPTNGAASSAPFGGVGASGNHRPSAYYAADYAAWPVASLEAEVPSATITTGLR